MGSVQALQAIRAAAMQQMPQLEVRAISNIAYGFACVHFWDGPLMDACAQRVMEQTTEINGQVTCAPQHLADACVKCFAHGGWAGQRAL